MGTSIFDLSGKTAIVTGAARGLGRFFSGALARAGADVAVVGRNIDSLAGVVADVERIGRKSFPVVGNVRDVASIYGMVESVESAFGKIDILVNNAGMNIRKPAVDVTEEDWNSIIETNLTGSFFTAQAVAKKMIPKKYGKIVNIGSVTSVFGYAGIAAYCASRGGVKQLTMSLADDWGRHGITVNCLAPGWFGTDQTKTLMENKAWVDYILDRLPLKRFGSLEELEGAIVFLASDASSYVTGQTILVDGGMTTGATKARI